MMWTSNPRGTDRVFRMRVRDLTKLPDQELESILHDPAASQEEKMEAWREMSRRHRQGPWVGLSPVTLH